jgi:hypothetical protein
MRQPERNSSISSFAVSGPGVASYPPVGTPTGGWPKGFALSVMGFTSANARKCSPTTRHLKELASFRKHRRAEHQSLLTSFVAHREGILCHKGDHDGGNRDPVRLHLRCLQVESTWHLRQSLGSESLIQRAALSNAQQDTAVDVAVSHCATLTHWQSRSARRRDNGKLPTEKHWKWLSHD